MTETFALIKIRRSINQRKIIWRRHALERMLERGLSRNMILEAASNGEVIEDYSADRPTPTALLLGWDKKRPIRIVLSIEPDEEVAILTAYEPSLEVCESDFRTRRKP
ncbi:MAG: DUF4258 domain-containing protein [Chloroflexi bacterium]|nr:DUF4258 domain-containing protein [Chloroflexota bacterium]